MDIASAYLFILLRDIDMKAGMPYSLYVIATFCSAVCSVAWGTIVSPPPIPVCYQPKQPGMCKAHFPRWWFSSVSRKCEQFIYGGCGGNSNNFMSESDCYATCDICQLPIKPDGGGPIACQAYIRSYGFNTTSCKCDKFIYSGCGGNENRFDSLKACSDKCEGTPCPPTCALPADPGPCEAIKPRYFYNTKTCQCEKFNYGGCEGNSNNFLSMEECLGSCRGFSSCDTNPNQCYLPEDSGKTCTEPDDRFHYDPLECKCKRFSFGGCEGNDNNFLSKRQCKRSCGNATCPICNLPKVPGPCKGSFPRYFYNIRTCQCEQFIYGGCGGNENQFTSLEDCQAICGTVQCPVCNLPSSKGSSNARLKRWYFDIAECTCKTFTYGGGGGNMNRFLTRSDCEGSCGSYPCPVCSLEKEVGPCRDAKKRWYYDSVKHKCRSFFGGGCKPNGNNFKTRKLCKKVCNGFRCSLPVQVGPCKASKPRFYFDNNTGSCKSFSWGGCQANGNNFKTLEGCENLCL